MTLFYRLIKRSRIFAARNECPVVGSPVSRLLFLLRPTQPARAKPKFLQLRLHHHFTTVTDHVFDEEFHLLFFLPSPCCKRGIVRACRKFYLFAVHRALIQSCSLRVICFGFCFCELLHDANANVAIMENRITVFFILFVFID